MIDSSSTFQHPLKSICSNCRQFKPNAETPTGLNHTQSRNVRDFSSRQKEATIWTVVFDMLIQFVKSKLCNLSFALSTGVSRLSLNQSLEFLKLTWTSFVLSSVRLWNAFAVTLPPILAIFNCFAMLKYSCISRWNVVQTALKWNNVCTGNMGRIYW